MGVRFIFLTLSILLFCGTYIFAVDGNDHQEHNSSMMGEMKEGSSKAVEVGNKICPVSGEVVGEMGPAVQYEYDGKLYNFCCAGCIATFKKDTEKYVKIVEEQMGQDMTIQAKGEIVPTPKVKEFDLEAYQHGYSPERIIVKKGDIVKLHATSRDVPHGIFIKEYGINVPVKKGTVEEIEFVADKTGEFDILCSVYCGRGHHDMKAKLIVQE